jgi:hypothetical protein
MATKKQKEELIEILKFTPRTYRLELGAYGGECYFGKVDRKIYDFFKEHKIDLDEYASDWDDEKWTFVPDDLRPFPPGAPYDGHNSIQCSGATLDNGNYLTIYDENNDEVFQCTLDPEDLDNHGIEVNCWEEEYIDDYDEGTIVFWGGQGEKGLLFGAEIELKQPFDPKKIKLNYSNADGWCIVNGVEYNEEELDNNDYSTTGKWGENKWIIVGDTEEVYEGVSREDVDPDEEEQETTEWPVAEEPAKTDWFDKDVKPEYKGEYEVCIDAPWPLGGPGMAEWTGRTWKQDDKKVKITQWRGLTENPEA